MFCEGNTDFLIKFMCTKGYMQLENNLSFQQKYQEINHDRAYHFLWRKLREDESNCL
jgi:hypothetical protein